MSKYISIGWLLTVLCVLGVVLGAGPLASTEEDAARALDENKRLRLKDDADEHERALWEAWIKMKPKAIETARLTLKDAERALRLSRSGAVGEAAVQRVMAMRDKELVALLASSGQLQENPESVFVGEHAAFRTKAIKQEAIERYTKELADAKALLKGFEGGYAFWVAGLWSFADRASGAISEGMIGSVHQVRVTSVLSDTEFVGIAQSLESGAYMRQCVFTNYDTQGLVDDMLLDGAFTVRHAGVRDVGVVFNGQIASKRLYVLEACSFYDMLEAEPAKQKGSKGKEQGTPAAKDESGQDGERDDGDGTDDEKR